MCGITGFFSPGESAASALERLKPMCNTLSHRGPDELRMDFASGVAFGVTRLSIIDVENGHQPYFNERRTVKAIFNGEIYNFVALRQLLIEKGHSLASGADGEVIVHLWEEYGLDFLSHLNGMFAIALHDLTLHRLFLIRDRLGIKPLYYSVGPDTVVFGSEIKSLLASGLLRRELDLDGLGEFLSWEYVPAPHTLFRNIRKLRPGCFVEIDLTELIHNEKCWWDVPLLVGEGEPHTPDEWEEIVDSKIRASVQRQLVSDVPLGTFLSGGVDSSLVVAAAGSVKAFTIGFEDPSYNELESACEVAGYLGLDHTFEVLRSRDLELFDSLMEYLDDPIGDFSIFPTYLISKLAQKDVKVALSGDGGDETFGGYEAEVAQQLARIWIHFPRFLGRAAIEEFLLWLRPRPQKKGLLNRGKRFVEGLQHPSSLKHARWRLFLGESLRRDLFTMEACRQQSRPPISHIESLFSENTGREETNQQLYVDMKSYLADNCLVKLDRMSMACSLEARVPFLDHELVETASQIPGHLKVDRGRTKVLLKKVAARHVPHHCIYRSKQGFSIPLKKWLRTRFRALLEELLSPQCLSREGLFQVETVERLKEEHLQGRVNHSHLLWSLLVFQDWRQRWRV